ncbi:MAG: XRE family transcriptional regulator [Clostridiales bacterium]|jgi:transcriptional regulator with XRE-family HTH domain|nr:XRE family transcriptional regulator [Clostridiales bacterium]
MQIGEKIKQLRIRTGLTQEELASRCDLSKGFISQVERDITSPSIATLVDILESLGTNLPEFFKEPEIDNIVYKQEDAYSTEDEALGYKITWIIPNAQKNGMEPILLKLKPGGRTSEYSPHAGDVFGFVAAGAVTLWVGRKKWKVKKDECFYYAAGETYLIENHTKSDAEVIWVTSPPNF